MDKCFEVLVRKAQKNDNEAVIEIVQKFQPLIDKCSKRMGNPEDNESELKLVLIKLLKTIPIDNMSNESSIVSYISKAIVNATYKLSRKYSRQMKNEIELREDIIVNMVNDAVEDYIFVGRLMDKLPEHQRKILEDRFIKGYSDIEIADRLNISRQAVNRTKNRALNTLKEHICMEFMKVG